MERFANSNVKKKEKKKKKRKIFSTCTITKSLIVVSRHRCLIISSSSSLTNIFIAQMILRDFSDFIAGGRPHVHARTTDRQPRSAGGGENVSGKLGLNFRVPSKRGSNNLVDPRCRSARETVTRRTCQDIIIIIIVFYNPQA